MVGLPLSLRGEDTDQTRETRAFARRLVAVASAAPYPSSSTTSGSPPGWPSAWAGRPAASEDSVAAAHLLESWLASRSR